MDRAKFVEILITVIVTVLLREVVTYLVKKTQAATVTVKPIATSLFKRHWRLLPIMFDLLILASITIYIASYISDTTPATRGFVVTSVLMGLIFVSTLEQFGKHVYNYMKALHESKK